MAKSTFSYVIFIRTTPEHLWSALTMPDVIKQYWFGVQVDTEWKSGAPWRLILPDGRIADTGEILEAEPPKRLVIKWRNEFRPELKAEGYSTCTLSLEPDSGAVKLTLLHEIGTEKAKFIEAVSGGWPRIISNLKSLLETGEVALSA
jgi:uncharacterized protein YndB with AHSA1/START domain